MILDRLNSSCGVLKGIGQRYVKILSKIGIRRIADLLEYFPRSFSDRTKAVTLSDAVNMKIATVKIVVTDHRLVGRKNKPFLKVLIYDGKNYGSLVCFNRNYLSKILTIGSFFYITGKFSINFSEIQSSGFDIEEASEEYRGRILPIYRLTEGLNQNVLRVAVEDALKKYRLDVEDELPLWVIKKRGLLHKREAIAKVHFPESFEEYRKAKMTFIYEEFFYQKLFLLNRKEKLKKIKKTRKKIDFKLKKEFLENLPFELTDYQKKAIDEIEKDIFSDGVFSRLLQGDVGSGKTIVAILSALSVIEAGEQVAFMAPTEILAKQHYKTMRKLCAPLSLDIALLTGNLTKKERDNILGGLKRGEIKIIVGTHALFTEEVVYKNLGFAIIDEQHRFGVEQRYKLLKKGEGVDLLLTTATPIPRSLAMALYGDLSLAVMAGTIDGRLPVKTWLIDDNEERMSKMRQWIKEQIDDNGRALFVYSLIEESEKSDNKDLYNAYENLKNFYGEDKVGFIHGKMKAEDKDAAMDAFREGRFNVLVSTTVVEVGLDVPEANVIVVENAENYGLSALHQLRGRVGRNNKQGYMILISKLDELSDDGKKRLEIMTKENDGFKIAEEDLNIRGPGDFIGSRQSGLPDYKFGDIRDDFEILKEASEDADFLYQEDSLLEKIENLNVKASFYSRLDNYENNYSEYVN